MNNQDFIDQLKAYVTYAFDNERAFLKKFYDVGIEPFYGLDSFYMSGSLCYYEVSDGCRVIDWQVASTQDFLNWVEES